MRGPAEATGDPGVNAEVARTMPDVLHGAGDLPAQRILTLICLIWVKPSSMPSSEASRPKPEVLYPP